MNKDFAPLLLGKDLRPVDRANEVARTVDNQESFDPLFNLLLHHERLLVIRAAELIEKITIARPEFLQPHKDQLMKQFLPFRRGSKNLTILGLKRTELNRVVVVFLTVRQL